MVCKAWQPYHAATGGISAGHRRQAPRKRSWHVSKQPPRTRRPASPERLTLQLVGLGLDAAQLLLTLGDLLGRQTGHAAVLDVKLPAGGAVSDAFATSRCRRWQASGGELGRSGRLARGVTHYRRRLRIAVQARGHGLGRIGLRFRQRWQGPAAAISGAGATVPSAGYTGDRTSSSGRRPGRSADTVGVSVSPGGRHARPALPPGSASELALPRLAPARWAAGGVEANLVLAAQAGHCVLLTLQGRAADAKGLPPGH